MEIEGGIVVNIIKIGVTTLVVSRFVKATGQKEINEIIVCTGILACGVIIISGITPLIEGIQKFNGNITEGIQCFNNLLDKLLFWK